MKTSKYWVVKDKVVRRVTNLWRGIGLAKFSVSLRFRGKKEMVREDTNHGSVTFETPQKSPDLGSGLN